MSVHRHLSGGTLPKTIQLSIMPTFLAELTHVSGGSPLFESNHFPQM
jgi:hypothetical protein